MRCRTARAANPDPLGRSALSPKKRGVPIRPCSGWGLPCGRCHQPPGALLPHPFSLACARDKSRGHRRSALCGTFPMVAHGGRYPPPLLRGARTFLDPCGPRLPGPLAGLPYADRAHLGRPRALGRKNAPFSSERLAWRSPHPRIIQRVRPSSRSSSSWNRIARISPSMMPSIRRGRQRRWNASTALCPSVMS